MSTRSTEPSPVDLHAHSTASDGTLSPADVVERAAVRGVRTLALTDHDTVAGIGEARQAASRLGIAVVSGIELSCAHAGKPLHVVGLGIDVHSPVLGRAIVGLATIRTERAMRIGARLAKLGIAGAYEGACIESGTPMPGRSHFARWLLARGVVAGHREAFDRLIGRGRPAYAATEWPSLSETVECIVAAGGIAVLAHPLRYQMTASWLRRIATEFRALGGQGVEISIARQSPQERQVAASLARRVGLLGSVGSDFHSPALHAAELGAFPPLPQDIEPIWSRLAA